MTPDPLSEKYYGLCPYAFCNNDPVNFVDVDGEAVETLWDIASIGMEVRSFVKNIMSGNAINEISPTNPKRQRYEDARRREFEQ